MSLPETYLVSVTTLSEQNIYSGPGTDYEINGKLLAEQETIAMRRTEDGSWLEVPAGWISADSVSASGDLLRLPGATTGIKATLKNLSIISIRDIPAVRGGKIVARLRKGDDVTVIGRTESGYWLQSKDGWILASYFETDGDIMALTVTDGSLVSAASAVSSPRSTPTPNPGLDALTIRSLVSRHTEDIRILDIKVSNSATTVEYDLKPWPFVPNESIANEVVFKVICAIRNGQQIPNTLKFMGQSHFKSDVGRRFTSPSVEIHISASNANRIVCSGNNASDINWRSISSRYKSYPIPTGASVDYD